MLPINAKVSYWLPSTRFSNRGKLKHRWHYYIHWVPYHILDIPLTRIVMRQSKRGCSLWWPVVMILWNTMIKRSACVPVNTGMSIGMVAVYGLFKRTPKLRSPERRSRIKTPMCIRPTLAAKKYWLTFKKIPEFMFLTLISSGVVQVIQNRHEDFQNIATFKDNIQKFLVVVAHFPKENQQLLVKMHFLRRIRQICLDERII